MNNKTTTEKPRAAAPRKPCPAYEIAAAFAAISTERARFASLPDAEQMREADAILANPPAYERQAFLTYAATDRFLTYCIRERERRLGSAEEYLEPLFNSHLLESSAALLAYRAVVGTNPRGSEGAA